MTRAEVRKLASDVVCEWWDSLTDTQRGNVRTENIQAIRESLERRLADRLVPKPVPKFRKKAGYRPRSF